MNLTGEQIKKLREALLSAYPSPQKLKEMLKINLNKSLDAIASGEDLRAVVFNLISVANSEGWSKELVVKAHEHNPGNELLRAIAARLTNNFSEDGRPLFADQTIAPQEEFDAQSFLARFEVPRGVVRVRDKLYVSRQADDQLQEALVKLGSTTSIRASRQSGKTSLLMRGLHHAKKRGHQVVFLNLQMLGSSRLTSLELFLHDLAETICRTLRLDNSPLAQAWRGSWGAQQKLTYFLEDHILPHIEQPLILAIDEADNLLDTSFYRDFFGLVRSWHDRRALNPDEWNKLNIVLVISTEPYLLIDSINQSPFNVGLKLALVDFAIYQLQWLNKQHGVPLTPKELLEFRELLGGQPYLSRQAFYSLVKEKLTWADLLRHAATDQGPFGQHLQRHYWAIHDKPALKQALKQVIRSNRCSDNTARLHLVKAGLINHDNGLCNFRCELYREYFVEML